MEAPRVESENTTYDTDERPAKKPCLDPPTHDVLPNSPNDTESNFYNTPLAMNTPAKEEDISNLPELTPTVDTVTRVSIPGLGMWDNGKTELPRVGQTQTQFEASAEAIVDDAALPEAGALPTTIQIEGHSVASQEEDQEMADAKGISEVGDSQLSAEAPTEGTINYVAVTKLANGVRIQEHNESIKLQGDQEIADAKLVSQIGESRPLHNVQADDIVSYGAIPPAPNFANGFEIPDNPEWEADSSPYQSSSSSVSTDSSSESSPSDDDSEDDGEDYQLLTAAEQVRILMQEERGSDDEDHGGPSKVKDPVSGLSRLRTTNERPDAIFPIPDITLTPESKITPLGAVESVVENTVLVKANVAGDYQVLETGSVLCLSNRSIIGVVAETLGRVQQPLYTVRFPNIAAVQEKRVADKGTEIFYVDEHSSFVFIQALRAIKGSDASNIHDEEVGEYEVEFSDDEKEAEYKRQLKLKKRGRRGGDEGFAKPPRGTLRQNGQSYSSAISDTNYDDASSMISYDDDVGDGDAYDEGYTPLARPSNLHEMMGSREAPQESWNPEASRPPQTHSSDRANRRGGHHRGGMRGGRGRGGNHRGRGRDRRGFDNRQNGHRDDEDRRPPYPNDQSSHTPHSSQYNPPHPQSQSCQPPQSNSPTSSMPSPAFTNSYSPYQSRSQNFHFHRSSPLGQQPNPFPTQLSHGSQTQPNSHTYPQPQPYQSPSSSSSFPHMNPAFYAAMQQQQQQAYGVHPQSQSYPHSNSYSNPPTSTAPGAPDEGGGISDILRRLGSGA